MYAFAQSAEAREAGLLLRASEAEAAVCRERVAGARKATVLEETEGLVAQVWLRGLNPVRTAVPFWGQTSWDLNGLSPKRDCGSKRLKRLLLARRG